MKTSRKLRPSQGDSQDASILGEDRGTGLPLITEDEVRERLQYGFDLFHRSKEGRPTFEHYTRESTSIVSISTYTVDCAALH